MDTFETAPEQGGRRPHIFGRLALLMRAIGDRLFQADDARASQYGWQIRARHGGLARTYRDPRFDRFRSAAVERPVSNRGPVP